MCISVCLQSHVCTLLLRILCILCVYTVCFNVLCMVEVKTNHLHLHNQLSCAYVMCVHSVNYQSLAITLPHTPAISQTTQPDEKALSVTQYHFTSWPDHGVPKFATSLISFIRRVQKAHNKDDGVPLLVHCSAGVGRTGTFILLDSMLERIKAEKTVNVYEFLVGLRQKRVPMVQTLV